LWNAVGGATAQIQDADRQGEEILDAMVHLLKQEILPRLSPLVFGDVSGDFRGRNDLSALVSDRRNSERNIKEAPVFALSNGLVVIHVFAATNALKDHGFFVRTIRGNEDRHRLAHGFFRGITKKELGRAVPTHNDAVEVLGKDRIGRRFDNGCVVLSGELTTQTLGGRA
jgi:hypothetical protein